MFSIYFWPMTLLWAFITAAMAGGLAATARGTDKKGAVGAASIIAFVLGVVLHRIVLYYGMPAFTGSFFGYWTMLFWSMVVALPVGCLMAKGGRAIGYSVLAVLLLIGWPTLQYTAVTFGPGNSKNFADLPNVRVAGQNETMPLTDPHHLVRVTENMARFKAKTALTTKGASYSTRYSIGELTLQAVKQHRYWAAPLVPNNNNDTFWTPVLGGLAESPGYVLVDAEDPEANATLRDGYHITLFENGAWNNDLERFAYRNGYDKGTFEDAMFEVDEDFVPHYAITYVEPAFGNIAGKKVKKILVVDVSKHEPVITAHDPAAKEIAWVDRVMSKTLISQYATWWGTYGQEFALSSTWNWFQIWTGMSKQDVMVPADGDEGVLLSYTSGEHNVWVIPMTSLNNSDHSVLGVLVFETNKNQAVFYPGLRGFNHGNSVSQTMFGANDNSMTKFGVENLELYNIYGKLTWVGIYTKSQSNGSTFGGIGFMDAEKQNVADVAFGRDVTSALDNYQGVLARGSAGLTQTGNGGLQKLDGIVWRIGTKGAEVWRFQLRNDNHFFDADLKSFDGMPLVRDGDHVTGSYLETENRVAHVKDLTIVEAPAATKVEPAKTDAK